MIIFARFFSLLFFFLCLIKPFRRLQILYIYILCIQQFEKHRQDMMHTATVTDV